MSLVEFGLVEFGSAYFRSALLSLIEDIEFQILCVGKGNIAKLLRGKPQAHRLVAAAEPIPAERIH
jgi:hypothetical protein